MTIGQCNRRHGLCRFLHKFLPAEAELHFSTKFFPAAVVIATSIGKILISDEWNLQDAIIEVSCQLYPFPYFQVAIGSFLSFPKKPPIFAESSTLQLGMFMIPATTGFSVAIHSRGTWIEPFGIPILHIEDTMAQFGIQWTGIPSQVIFGAGIWIGRKDRSGKLSHDNAIFLSAYVGLGFPHASSSFLYGTLSELSIKKVSR